MPRDVYEPPPPRATQNVSRRAFLGLARARGDIDYDGVTRELRGREFPEALMRALEPVDEVLADFASGRVLGLPQTAWREHDLQELPYGDGEFDTVLSPFGAALAPRPRRMARELVRVVRPGGVVAIAAWVPKGLPGRLDELLERPEGVRPPSDWGRQDVMRARFEPLLEELELRTRTVQLRFADAGRPRRGAEAARGAATAVRPAARLLQQRRRGRRDRRPLPGRGRPAGALARLYCALACRR